MTYVVTRRPLKLTNDKTFEVGDFITDEDFKDIPERILISRKRSLIEAGRIERTDEIPAPEKKAEAVTASNSDMTTTTTDGNVPVTLTYLPIGRWKLPNGDIVKGKKEDALKRWEELKETG